MKDSAQPAHEPGSHRHWQRSTLVRLTVIACLVLAGLIPLTLIRGVLGERRMRHQEALANITSTWGSEQRLAGPVLVVPYRRQVKTWKEQVVNGRPERSEVVETVVARAFFLPAELMIAGDLAPERLHRGIYEAVVYRAALQVSGRFARPSFEEWKVAPADVLWDEATVSVAITDLRGAKEALQLKWGDQTLALLPGTKVANLGAGVHARLGGRPFTAESIAFALTLAFQGSQNVSFAPFGMRNEVRLKSSWPDPSFNGAFLPSHRTVTASGFEADWQLSYYGRSYPQQWCDHDVEPFQSEAVNGSMFGVSLFPGVDSYRFVERSIKYGVLFLALVFTAFFVYEVRSPIRVHPIQYTLVGAGLCLFYLALLALSEITAFGLAYAAGAATATLLIACYSAVVLRGARRAWIVAAGLAVIYGFLFLVLQQQEYSLLYGTAGLFLVLAIVMYATRKIDWYAREGQ